MNFFSHKIANPTNTSQSLWNDWLNKNFATAEVKEASEAKPECDDDPRGQCRGQVINNDNEESAHSYQEGESVDGKKDQAESGSHKPNKTEPKSAKASSDKTADCHKEMGESSKAGDVTEKHSPAANASDGKDKVEQNINNDPNYQKGESTNSKKTDKKTDSKKKTDKKSKEANSGKFVKVASLDRKGKLELFAFMTSKKDKNGKAAYPMSYVEAMVGVTFANMKDDEKEWFKKFWRTQYPDSYVEEMVSDR